MAASTFAVFNGATLLGYALFERDEVKLLPNKLSPETATRLLEALNTNTLPAKYRLKPTKPAPVLA